MFNKFVDYVRDYYGSDDFIPLHEPRFIGKEKEYLLDVVDSTYVSSVGAYVNKFEQIVANYIGVKHGIATVNGTSALHIALLLAGVERGHEVITQSMSFIATCNAIDYCGATPVFVDVDKSTMGMSAASLEKFLLANADIKDDGSCINKNTGNIISACVPMHTFGHPVRLDELSLVCDKYGIALVEDAAESLGSFYKGKHTGTTGILSAISFNGNKIITTGGGGMILTDSDELAAQAKHIITTAKMPHKWNFVHDRIGYNYRMPNLNAAFGCAQMEELPFFITEKRKNAALYKKWCSENGVCFIDEPKESQSNFWLNAIVLKDKTERDEFLEFTNAHEVMTRPLWVSMHKLNMFKHCIRDNLENTEWLEDRVVNIPSSVNISNLK